MERHLDLHSDLYSDSDSEKHLDSEMVRLMGMYSDLYSDFRTDSSMDDELVGWLVECPHMDTIDDSLVLKVFVHMKKRMD